MRTELERPPAKLGPRLPTWLKLLLVGVVGVALAWFSLIGLTEAPSRELALFLVIMGEAGLFALVYVQSRFVYAGTMGGAFLRTRGVPVGEPDGERRTADRAERTARKAFRRGRMTRLEYERTIAYRRFVHGELTQAEYHARLRELAAELSPRSPIDASPP